MPKLSIQSLLDKINTDREKRMAAHEQHAVEIKAKSDALKKDDDLAVVPGKTPEQIAARQRTARLFCEIHLLEDKPADRDARLAAVDYSMPVQNVDARKVDMNPPKKHGFLGIGAKPTPQYWVSARFTPQTPEDPVYAFQYYPLKKG